MLLIQVLVICVFVGAIDKLLNLVPSNHYCGQIFVR